MGAGEIVYALVARGSTVFVEHTRSTGNFQQVTRTILDKFESSADGQHSYTYDSFLFHISVDQGLIFLAMTTVDFERRIAFAFLDDVRESFLSKYAHLMATAVAYEMNRTFAEELERKIDFYTNNPQADKLRRVQGEVAEVKQVMVDNIEKILDRGDKIELLVDKAEDLSEQATKFKKSGSELKAKMWWSQFKLQLIICSGIGLLLLVIVLSATKCFGQC